MNQGRQSLPVIAPPRGGLAGLKARIRRRRQYGSAVATVLAVVATAWLFVEDPRPVLPGDVAGIPLARLNADRWEPAIRIRGAAVQSLASDAPGLRLYWVVALETPDGEEPYGRPFKAPSALPLPGSG